MSYPWALTGDVDDCRQIAGEGEMRLTSRLGVEAARPERLGRSLIGLLAVSEMPGARNDERGPVVPMAVCGDSSVGGDADLERVRPRRVRIAREDRGLDAAQPGRARARALPRQRINLRRSPPGLRKRGAGVQKGADSRDCRLRLFFHQPMPGIGDHHLVHIVSGEPHHERHGCPERVVAADGEHRICRRPRVEDAVVDRVLIKRRELQETPCMRPGCDKAPRVTARGLGKCAGLAENSFQNRSR